MQQQVRLISKSKSNTDFLTLLGGKFVVMPRMQFHHTSKQAQGMNSELMQCFLAPQAKYAGKLNNRKRKVLLGAISFISRQRGKFAQIRKDVHT